MINEHNDPNLAETPHYKEKQTILPHPISAEVEKKTHTPVKRLHDGKPKKDKKDPCKSPMINEQSSPKEICIKADEAKIDMRKLIIEHKKSSSSSIKKHSSSSSLSSSMSKKDKDRDKHKTSSSDSHRSHSSSKKSHSSDKHRRDESRKSSSTPSSNHSSSSSEKHKSNEIASKKVEPPKVQTNPSQPIVMNESTIQNEESEINKANAEVLPVQINPSLHTIDPVVSPAIPAPTAFANPIVQNPQEQVIPSAKEQPSNPPPPPPPEPPSTPFDIPPLPPLPKEMPIEIPPPPPPPPREEEQKSHALSKSGTSPDSSTQQASPSSAPPSKVRRINNGDKAAPSSDLLGSIMASMDSPKNSSNF